MNQPDRQESILIKNVLVGDPNSKHNGKRTDILISNGVIEKIGKSVKEPFGTKVISGKDLAVNPGWMDLHTNIPDPGFEYKEDIQSALNAAAAGGFTSILSCSNTDPTIDGKSEVEYQLKKAQGHLVDLKVSGAMSKDSEGKELSEMFDMHRAGAVAFYDYKGALQNTQLLKLALQYTKSFNGLIMNHPTDPFLTEGAMVNEGVMSTVNGLDGMPSIAEEIGIERALKLAQYTDHRIHLTSISTVNGIDLVKQAKKKKIAVTAGVTAASLLFNEDRTLDFNTNFKVNPPLRDEKTRKELIKALLSGTIDVVISDHWPQNIENKDCEFDLAEFGMNTLETAYAMVKTALGDKLDIEQTAELMSIRPRTLLNLPTPNISIGEVANLTVFAPNEKWEFNVKDSLSLSRNLSLEGITLEGKVMATLNNRQYFINQ